MGTPFNNSIDNLTAFVTIPAMPRQAQLDAAGVVYHIMIRGIEGRDIFRSDKDRNDFTDRWASLLPEALDHLLHLGVYAKSCSLSFIRD